MNKSFKALAILLSLSLAACSSNTERENIALGTVAGAVAGGAIGSTIGAGTGQLIAIGTGIVAGGIIGGSIGKSMDSTDKQRAYSALNHNATHESTSWRNENNGARYKVTPLTDSDSVKIKRKYKNCRQYQFVATLNGKTSEVYGTACQQADGTWQAVNP